MATADKSGVITITLCLKIVIRPACAFVLKAHPRKMQSRLNTIFILKHSCLQDVQRGGYVSICGYVRLITVIWICTTSPDWAAFFSQAGSPISSVLSHKNRQSSCWWSCHVGHMRQQYYFETVSWPSENCLLCVTVKHGRSLDAFPLKCPQFPFGNRREALFEDFLSLP